MEPNLARWYREETRHIFKSVDAAMNEEEFIAADMAIRTAIAGHKKAAAMAAMSAILAAYLDEVRIALGRTSDKRTSLSKCQGPMPGALAWPTFQRQPSGAARTTSCIQRCKYL